MDANEIRKIVNEVNPPTKGKTGSLTLTADLSGEIAQVTPFWSALLRNRDIRDSEGGDEYITGLIEAFARIYVALKTRNLHGMLAPLDLDTLYSLDTNLQQNDMGLADEYPALEMVNVKEMGAYGAGVLMAYALFETALAVKDSTAPGTAPDAQSLADDLLAGLPEDETSNEKTVSSANTDPNIGQRIEIGSTPLVQLQPGSASRTDGFSQATSSDWSPHAKLTPAKAPLVTIGIFRTQDGLELRGSLPQTMLEMSEAYSAIRSIFGAVNPGIRLGDNGLEFYVEFVQSQRGGRP